MQRFPRHHGLAVLALGLGLVAGGCAGTVTYSASATVSAPAPTLVAIGNGVWVVADYDEPIFWYSDFYWRFYGGVWYRSTYVNSGWVRYEVHAVPVYVRTIDRPTRYVRYRAPRGSQTRAVPARHVHAQPAPQGQARGHQDPHPGRGDERRQGGVDHPGQGDERRPGGDEHPGRGDDRGRVEGREAHERDERGRDERGRDDRGRDDAREHDDRGRDDRGRDDARERDERGRDDRGRDDARERDDRGRDDRGRDDARERDERGRDDRGRDDAREHDDRGHDDREGSDRGRGH